MRKGLRILALGIFWALPLWAESVSGPDVRLETSASGSVSSTTEENLSRVSHQRLHGNLFFPLPAKPLGITLIPRVDIYHESRRYEQTTGSLAPLSQSLSTLNALAVGAMLSGNFGEKDAHEWYGIFSRYGSPDFSPRAGGLYEAYLGARLIDFLSLTSSSRHQQTLFLFRIRHFPFGFRLLPFVGQRYAFSSGWYLDVLFPSHALAGWESADEHWRFSGGLRFNSRDYPFESTLQSGWVEGNTLEIFLSARRHLYGVVFLLLEGGMQAERLRVHNSSELLGEYSTAFSPWIGLSFKTLFPASR